MELPVGTASGGVPDPRWTSVDEFIGQLIVRPPEHLQAALDASEAAGLPSIAVSAAYGKLIHLLARAVGARKILEIGTLGGYSGIWLASALPRDGELITLELDPKHAEVARSNFARAGVADRVDVRVGPAIETLPALDTEAPFDLVFIDADKPAYTAYFEWSLKLSRPGTLILADNVVRQGAIVDPAAADENVRGIRSFLDALAKEPRVSATVIQTVGAKGYDGLALALVQR
jgi:predicted O-methyltransferase YrrM